MNERCLVRATSRRDSSSGRARGAASPDSRTRAIATASPLSDLRPRTSPEIDADVTIGLITQTAYPASTRKSWNGSQ